MKARVIWIALSVALVGVVGYRVASVKKSRGAPREESAQVTRIRAVAVGRADLVEKLAFTGTIRPRNEVDLFPKVPGRIERLAVEVGDKVKAGQTLAVVEHREIAWQAKAAQAALQLAKANLDGARLEHDRTLALFKAGSATQALVDGVKVRLALAEAQLAQAEAGAGLAQQSVANASIVTPIAGVVTRRPVNVGTQLGPQSIVATVQDVATLKLEGSVDAAAYARLARGSPAFISVDTLPGQTFHGKVSLLSPSLDATSRRASIEIEIDNTSGRLLPNMFARVEVVVGSLPQAMFLPKTAVYETAGAQVVYRVKGEAVEAVRPKLGAVDGERIAVLEGLAEGERVAVTGLANLADGAAVKLSE